LSKIINHVSSDFDSSCLLCITNCVTAAVILCLQSNTHGGSSNSADKHNLELCSARFIGWGMQICSNWRFAKWR